MAHIPGGFNTQDKEEMGFGVLPKEKYLMEIVESEYVQNSLKTGHYLKLVRVILEGKYKGRKFYSNLNLDNPNPKTVEIANKEFTSTCKACGLVAVEDSEELHGIPHYVTLAVRAGKNNAPDQNMITDIQPADGYASPDIPVPSTDSAAPKADAPPRRRAVFDEDDE